MSDCLRLPSRFGRIAALAAVVVVCASVARAEVIGDIVRVGYLVTSGAAIRTGAWTPIVVDLTLQNQASFDGLLRVRQFDRDGDAYVDSVPVHLSDTGGGAQQRYWLYTVANPRSDRANLFEVELLATESGSETDAKLVQVISGGVPVPAIVPPVPAQALPDNDYVILEVSDAPLGPIRRLLDPEYASKFDRTIDIAHGSPNDLPGQWIGLDMVDCVVWENADPTRLTPAQQHALVEWMRQGGKLVMAAGRTSDAVAESTVFGPLLPVRVGTVRSTADLPTVRNRLLGLGEAAQRGYPRPVVYAECSVLSDPEVKHVLFDEGAQSTLVSARRVGRGRLVFVAAALADLTADGDADVPLFYQRLLELRGNSVSEQAALTTPINLFRFLDREVGFYESGAGRLAVVIVFSVAYVLLGTLGVWRLLQSRNQLKHSWTALAIVGAAASVLSLIGVQAVHGVGRDVRQLTVVDGVANEVAARGTAYFGLRTATHNRLDLWLPADYRLDAEPTATACALKPMPEPTDSIDAGTGFTDPGRYWLLPSTAEVHDVPLRATLKQFEGRWQGDLRGTVLSSVTTQPVALPDSSNTDASVEKYGFTQNSWIENGLDVDLRDCQLFLAKEDTFSPQRFVPIGQRAREPFQLRVFKLDSIAAGERVNLFQRVFLAPGGGRIGSAQYNGQGLHRAQKTWGSKFINLVNVSPFGDEDEIVYDFDHYQNALLLATVMSDIDRSQFEVGSFGGLPIFSRARMRQLDIADLIQPGWALLVGFSDSAGPVRLCARTHGRTTYERIEPERPRTVYRFLIPVTVGDDL